MNETLTVAQDVIDVLRSANIEGQQLILSGQLERNLYERTDRVLQHIGGAWVRRDQAHCFPHDVDLPEVVGRILESGEADAYTGMSQPGWRPQDVAANEGTEVAPAHVIPLVQFVEDFGDGLMQAVSQQNPPVYDGRPDPARDAVMDGLKRQPFPAQREVVQAVTRLLVEADEQAAIVNAEMGTGKTMMAIAAAAVLHREGYRRTLIISPPHLVYKWRREILETVADANVWVLNGPDTLRQLLKIRRLGAEATAGKVQEFYVIGRVRMRMGFDWMPVALKRKLHVRVFTEANNSCSASYLRTDSVAACPRCGTPLKDENGALLNWSAFMATAGERRQACTAEFGGRSCGERLWTLKRSGASTSRADIVKDALCQLPTIGPKTADKLLRAFGPETLAAMLSDNPFDFINLMDEDGELVFEDRQAMRMEKRMATQEFAFGQGGYQPTEYIKRYLPQGFFDLLIVDEGHEFKNEGSAQGQAMGVLAAKCRKTILMTGTLMGGYADDLFVLLWRILTRRLLEDGYRVNARGSLAPAAMAFMREHGVLKDVFKETDEGSHRTARGKRLTVHTKKAPGFGPKGIARYVLPYTVFLKLKDIGGNVLPAYDERLIEVALSEEQAEYYGTLRRSLVDALKDALRKGDKTLLGVVLNALLAWPECCFRMESVKHPRTGALLASAPPLFEAEPTPKERELVKLCREQKARGRRVLAYTIYTGTRDTTLRLRLLLQKEGFAVSVLRSSVPTEKREDWILDQVDRGVDVLICNPELVKTGLDLLDFPAIVFLQSGFNVYTVQQASRRSWRIGQKQPVEVFYLSYAETAQSDCLRLMAKKIAVSQSTSGDTPETGLDALNQEEDSLEVVLAKRLIQ